MTLSFAPEVQGFLSELAHDLRNLLEGMDAALSNELSDPSLRDVSYREIYDLILKTESYLDRQKLQEHRLELRPERVDMVESANTALRRLGPYLRQRKLRSSLGPDDCEIRFDRRCLEKILDRILYASVKLTGQGDEIALSIHAEDDFELMVLEIPAASASEARVERLFSPDDARAWALWAPRELARLQGGDFKWQDGNRFRIELPRADAKESREIPPSPAGGKPRVLVVDDNVDSARSLAMLLSLAGHETHVRSNGREALRAVRDLQPDVVLLDLGLPDIHGYEVCRTLRADPLGSELRLVAVSGHGDSEARRMSQEAGFDAHLLKPVDKNELLRVLNG